MDFHKKNFIPHENSFTAPKKNEIPKVYLVATSGTCAHDMATLVPCSTNRDFFQFHSAVVLKLNNFGVK